MKKVTAQFFSKVRCILLLENIQFIFLIIFYFSFLSSNLINGQTIIFQEDFENASVSQSNLNTANYIGWSNINLQGNNNRWWIFDTSRATVPTGNYALAVSRNSPYTGGGTKPRYNRNYASANIAYYTSLIDASAYSALTLDFNWIGQGEIGYDYGFAVYSLDGINWYSFTNTVYLEGQSNVQNVSNLDVSELDGQQFYLGFYWTNDNSIGSNPSLVIDDISIKGSSSGYCSPSTAWADTCFIDNVQFVGTLNDVSTLNSSYGSNDGYQDWTSQPKAIQAQGEGVNIIADAGGTRGAWKAWVDWNKNNQFEVGEEVYNPGAFLATNSDFGFVIPDNQTPGDYRIRIRIGINYWNWNGNGFFEFPDEEFYYDFDACEDFTNSTYLGQADYYFGEAEDYLFTVIEKCDSHVVSVTDGEACGVNQTVNLSFEGAGTETVTGFNIYDSETGGNLVGTTGISGSTGNWTTPSISATTTYWVTATSACSNGESLVRVPVTAYISPIPTLSFTTSSSVICGEDAIVEITASGDKETVYLIDEDFESGLGAFITINNDSNTAIVSNITQWQIESSTHNTFSGNVWSPAISSGVNNNQFAMATSDHINSASTSAKSVDNSMTLTTAVNTTNFVTLQLSFDLFYLRYFPDNYNDPSYEEFVDIDISTDNGSTWTTLERLDEDLGYGTSFINKTYDLVALGYNNVSQLKIRFRHYSWADDASGFGWLPDGVALDNIKLWGEKPLNTACDWNNTANTYIDAAATIQYISGTSAPVSTIYVKPLPTQLQSATSFIFTASAILNNGCSASTVITLPNNTKYLKDPSPDKDWDDPLNWLPGGVPNEDNCVIIPDECRLPNSNGIPPVGYNGYAKNLTIKGTGDLTIFPDNHLTVTDWIHIESGGVLDVKSGANLIQVTDVVVNENTGDMNMERTVNGLNATDYVYWSSPIDQFNVQDISSATNSEYIYQWIPTLGNNYGNWQPVSGNMAVGKGYIVRGLQTTSPPNTARFIGTPNNGLISNVPIQRGTYGLLPGETGYFNSNGVWVAPEDDNWNLIGNPYPSSISANQFTNDNPNIDGTIYLWTHASAPNTTNGDPFYDDFEYNYNPSDYIEHNNTGSNPPGTNDLYIASGQAFFVLMLDNATQNEYVTFSNTMRSKDYNNTNFYGPNLENDDSNTSSTSAEKHRIWLDLITSDNLASSILVGYIEGATNDKDRLYDGYEFAGSALSFYSLIGNDKMSIQGKALPFSAEDKVPLGLVVPKTDNYKIAINTLDGLFENDNQAIFIEDTYTNIIHNLRTSPYSFNADKGTFNDRFILRYTNETLSINEYELGNDVRVIAFDNTLKITSNNQPIKAVKIIDIQGRLIKTISNIDTNNYINHQLNFSQATYIIKVTLGNGKEIAKKVIF
jgi:hypothetical protein